MTGTRLRLHVDLIRHPRQPVHLAVNLTEPNHSPAVRTVAPVVPGTRSYDISLPSACASGCRVAALDLTANTPDNPDATSTHVSEIDAVIGAVGPLRRRMAAGRRRSGTTLGGAGTARDR